MDIAGKTIWIIGASSGIGRETARQLSRQGARLILSSRNVDALREAHESCHAPHLHLTLPMDLEEQDGFPGAVAKAWSHTGSVHTLINSGGVSVRSLALDTPSEVDRRVMEIDYFGAVVLVKTALPKMLAQGQGHVVTIASVSGKIGSPMRSAYCGAKHAVIGFMDSLRPELHGSGVKIHVVCPGWVQTDISRNALTSSGAPYGRTDAEISSRMPVEQFVAKMIKQLRRDTPEVVIASGLAAFGYHGHRLFPNLYHRLLPRVYRRRE